MGLDKTLYNITKSIILECVRAIIQHYLVLKAARILSKTHNECMQSLHSPKMEL